MAHKNRSIRFSDLRAGVTIYSADGGKEVCAIQVLNKPRMTRITEGISEYAFSFRRASSLREHEMFSDSTYLSSAGMQGFDTQGRPPIFYMSRRAAERALPKVAAWYEYLRSTRDPADDFFDSLDHHGGDDRDLSEEAEEKHLRFEGKGVIHLYVSQQTTEHHFQQVDFRIWVPEDQAWYYGYRASNGDIRIDYMLDDHGSFLDEPRMFFVRRNEEWKNVSNDVGLYGSHVKYERRHEAKKLPADEKWTPILNGKLEFLKHESLIKY
jgi:hypothetical protein